eukprot:m.237810 g.237810  ORF g.237810 m.237810 type:complete len:53 (+) comp26219_c1_seq7:2693-2851(+)
MEGQRQPTRDPFLGDSSEHPRAPQPIVCGGGGGGDPFGTFRLDREVVALTTT